MSWQAAAQDPGGFRGLKWSQSAAECKKQGMCSDKTITVRDQIGGETIHYGRSETLDGIPLVFSSFAFYGNKFYSGTA